MLAKKSLGQNFLMHAQTAERIVLAARVPKDVPVLEIGPGTGMLTRVLLAEGYRVIAVEADDELVPELERTFASEIEEGRLALVHADIREFDTATLPVRYALIANIPYYITGEIIRSFLTGTHKPLSMTLLVQKEVAERIARQGKKAKESLLSLSVKAYGTPRYCFTVPKGAFRPAPSVDSAVISIDDIDPEAFGDATGERLFFETIRAGFAHKRKLLAGNLAVLHTPEAVSRALTEANIPEKSRAEDLSLADWRRLIASLQAENH